MNPDVTLAILAGGESSRMGMPKSHLQLDGRPILTYLLDAIAWTGPTLLVSAPGRESPPGTERFDRQVFDPVSGLGPLRGILTALENASTQFVAVATVDMPGIRNRHLAWIVQQLADRPDLQGIMMTRAVDKKQLIEPFPSAYRRSAVALISAELSQQRKSVRGLLSQKEFATAQTPDEWDAQTWTNLTVPADVAVFKSR